MGSISRPEQRFISASVCMKCLIMCVSLYCMPKNREKCYHQVDMCQKEQLAALINGFSILASPSSYQMTKFWYDSSSMFFSRSNIYISWSETTLKLIFLPCPFDEVWQVIEQAEGVERIADDLCDSPGCDKQQHTVLTLHLHKHTQGMMGEGQRDRRLASCCWRLTETILHRTMLFVSDAERSDHTAGRRTLSSNIRIKPIQIWC